MTRSFVRSHSFALVAASLLVSACSHKITGPEAAPGVGVGVNVRYKLKGHENGVWQAGGKVLEVDGHRARIQLRMLGTMEWIDFDEIGAFEIDQGSPVWGK